MQNGAALKALMIPRASNGKTLAQQRWFVIPDRAGSGLVKLGTRSVNYHPFWVSLGRVPNETGSYQSRQNSVAGVSFAPFAVPGLGRAARLREGLVQKPPLSLYSALVAAVWERILLSLTLRPTLGEKAEEKHVGSQKRTKNDYL
jgi:hypothetical protein